MMAMPNDASKPRKGFVLKCDKPRYDGGVELNLEKYFGRRLQPSQAALNKLNQPITQQQVDNLKRQAQELLAALPEGSRMTLTKPKAYSIGEGDSAEPASQATCLNETPDLSVKKADEPANATAPLPEVMPTYLPSHFMVCGLSLLGGMVGMSLAHCLHDPMALHQSQQLLNQSWQAVCMGVRQSLPSPFKGCRQQVA